MVHTFFHNRRLFGRTRKLFAIDGRDGRKLALQHRRDFVPFRHDVIQKDIFLLGNGKTLFEQLEIPTVNRHRLIRKDVDARFERFLDILRLFAVVARLHHHVPFLLGQHLFEEIRARVNDFIPLGRILGTGVESFDSFQMFFYVETGGCVHINIFRNLRIGYFLYQCRMEMPRVQRNQLYLTRCSGKPFSSFLLLLRATRRRTYQQRRH